MTPIVIPANAKQANVRFMIVTVINKLLWITLIILTVSPFDIADR